MLINNQDKKELEIQFEKEYQKLNTQQKKAVDTIEGPVLVIAGPGTGKTQILAARIAKILSAGVDVQAQNILCLTYTDAGAIAMRKRLASFIGAAAHKVNIYTFHAFCNEVIQHHPEYFTKRESEPVSDLETALFYQELLDNLPEGHILRKLRGDFYSEVKKLKSLFALMKKEDLSVPTLQTYIQDYIVNLPETDGFFYKKNWNGFKAGDPKQKLIDAEIEKMNMLSAAVELFPTFQAIMLRENRYDFDDMILWVIRAFKENEILRLEYQERFQYILVDEFQDTSGSQKEILDMLTDYWGEDANLFVVGDDDQSIYEFQGARLSNIVELYQRYENKIEVIVLKENYRSTQLILDASKELINNNKDRLIHQIKKFALDKNLIAANSSINTPDAPKVVVKEYFNIFHEEADIVLQVEALREQGVPLNEIAVLYAKHKQAANIIRLFEKRGLPFQVRKSVNLLHLPLVEFCISLLQYIHLEGNKAFSAEPQLYRLLHHPALGINPQDIAVISLYIASEPRDKKTPWRLLLDNGLILSQLPLQNLGAIQQFTKNLNSWLVNAPNLNLAMLFENILYESGLVNFVLNSPDRIWDLQVINSFFNFMKEECARHPKMRLAEFITMLDDMRKEKIEVPITKVIAQENGVNFITAHSSKGLEFEYVFIIGCTKDYWESKKGPNSSYKIPIPVAITDNPQDAAAAAQEANASAQAKDEKKIDEATRRLFYVAMTRAKRKLQVSYSAKNEKSKEQGVSSFVTEILTQADFEKSSLSEEAIMQSIEWSLTPDQAIDIELVKREHIQARLDSFKLSVSALNKYLDCPVAFYYERLLLVPSAPSDTLAFGSAVHYALEWLFKNMLKNPGNTWPTLEQVLGYFDSNMNGQLECFTQKQFPRRMELGHKILTDYYNHYINTFIKNTVIEKSLFNVTLDGVPLTGKLDKIEFLDDAKHTCRVIDYKTGKPNGGKSGKDRLALPDDDNPLGGEYWRQMAFYKILLDNFPFEKWSMKEGVFQFIEKDDKTNQFVNHSVVLRDEDVNKLKDVIKDSYAKIMNMEFNNGCGKPECAWCNFVSSNQLIRTAKTEESEEATSD
ncbi:MAG: hypothetical protein RL138_8 [Bacteroidota bacterium]|jgi:DNA helicase-2/ATP-dependent DNA helicase PcrA